MRRAFSLAELLVVIAIGAVLTAILFPLIPRSRYPGSSERCRSNLKRLGTALQMYVQDYDDHLPPHGYTVGAMPYTLPYLLRNYLKKGEVWECPIGRTPGSRVGTFDGSPTDTTVHYGYNWSALEQNGVGIKLSSIHQPAYTVAFVDSSSYMASPRFLATVMGGTAPVYRHSARATVGWLDGHVKAMPARELEDTPGVENGKKLGSGVDAYRYWNRR